MAVVPTVLNRENYNDWSSRIKTYLLAEDLWDIVKGTYILPEKKKDGEAERKAWKKKNAKALYAIQSSCGDDAYKLIEGVTNAKEAWDSLSKVSEPHEDEDYNNWSSRIKTYLVDEELWDIVKFTDNFPKEEDGERKAWNRKNAKALYAIQSSCGDDAYKFIEGETNASEAWATLRIDWKPRTLYTRERDERSLVEAYPTRIDVNDGDAAMEEGRNAGHDEISNADDINATFVKHVESNDWDNVIKLLREHPQLRRLLIPIGFIRGTALHRAIMTDNVRMRIVEQLVELMTKDDLEIRDTNDWTALHGLVFYHPEWVELAKRMLEKNDKLLTIISRCDADKTPRVVAAQMWETGEEMARYLYSVTPHRTLRVTDGAELLSLGFQFKRFDIAWDLIQRYPELATAKDYEGDSPLKTLARDRHAFLSGSRLNFWENLIYNGIRIRPLPPIDVQKPESGQSDETHVSNKRENQRPLSDQKENQRHFSCSGMGLFHGLVTNLQKLLGINRIYDMKLTHERVKQFLPIMCKAQQYFPSKQSMSVAAEKGHAEFLTHFLGEDYVILPLNEKGHNMFQIAAECRHHKVYNLIYLLGEFSKEDPNKRTKIKNMLGWTDRFKNNILHTVARITSLSQIYHIRGAALQMQRELQWFKEVESIVDPKDCESVNADNMTPRQVFTDSHNDMGKEAEKSMKEIATSCTVVGALIITIMFAAAITVPGGNDGDTGLPTLTERVFTTFIVSDAISLFSSTTSVIMFLGILTSRYYEDDFRKSLPIKMIIGLFTLFLSIASMMIVFSCALYIMLKGKSSIVIPSILLASVPVTSFIWMQFPFLVELVISTFGPGLFDRNKKKLS